MKLLHIADLHLGKRMNGYSLIDDQKHVLNEILHMVDEQHPDAIVMAGDIYDKGVPSTEAVALMDTFLTRLKERQIEIFVCGGNHDSQERLSFGNKLMDPKIHISSAYDGHISPTVLHDKHGDVNVYMLPFVKPCLVRQYAQDVEIKTYDQAVQTAVQMMDVDCNARNVLVAHQFVTSGDTSPERCESEEVSVGGMDNVDASVFDKFDYVALGHLHQPQMIGRETVRYAGSILKYSLSELHHNKSVTMVTLGGKNEVDVQLIPLKPKTDMAEIKGTFAELTSTGFYQGKDFRNAYLSIVLTDEEDQIGAKMRLQQIYPNLIELRYDNRRTRSLRQVEQMQNIDKMNPMEVIAELYRMQNDKEISKGQMNLAMEILENLNNTN